MLSIRDDHVDTYIKNLVNEEMGRNSQEEQPQKEDIPEPEDKGSSPRQKIINKNAKN